ncbi:MAG: Type secretion bridge between inner and outerrane lipoprotein [Myxococcales bacterium]|nr:Type secretion bridge between inner and outerrane lipoprotein [Myxococcales bacterium]
MMAWRVLVVLSLAGCGVELEHNLDERQANEVASVLENAGIGADKAVEDGNANAYKIVVARGEAGRAFSLLEARDLPKRSLRGLSDTFAGGSLLPSPVEDRARYGAALAVELERSLEEIPGVVSARVHLALPPEEPLVGDAAHARPTASVLLKTTQKLALADADIKRLVAGAVTGLQSSDVGVVAAAGVVESGAPPLERVGPLRVAHESRMLTATLATSGLVVILLLSLALVFAALRLGQLRRRLRDLERSRP